MIIRERPTLGQLFFIYRGSVIQRIFPQMLVVVAMSAIIVIAHRLAPQFVPSVAGAPFTLIGIALSIFLSFRNSACYERWWEARKNWGELLAASRDLARQTELFEARSAEASQARRLILLLTVVLADELVKFLRGGDCPNNSAVRLLPKEMSDAIKASRHPPVHIVDLIGRQLIELQRNGMLSDVEFSLFDRTMTRLSGSLAACERLRTTPVPFGYTLLIHRTAHMFCFMVPFGFADVLGPATPLAAGLVAYTFFGLDALGDELEEPFGTLPNDLPIAAISTVIEIDLRSMLGDTDLPPMPKPVDHILL
ncbi:MULTISPECIES: bestrophin family protein [Rhizobiaceae]|jgi:putative membrane protein|uniref:Putative membrane protein n=1 Tax=Aliirhizobium cellulosilyticum TaxID=393664 RepID=A0A7W6V403_9HYPH|nr:bestrophin family protein [Rhizobium cellulosilyticum]MBB4351666.1 putative membrane protein [Rhizobium cellulosilyticum]MBB4414997.1 putative membrane protein [Rhizobium cellulosilyticum]MBB4449592.1 putative membrane protein [Rhizobium cellulosilyticum]